MNIFRYDAFNMKSGLIYVRLLLAIAAMAALFAQECFAETNAMAKVDGAVLTEYDFSEALNKLLPAASFHGGITPETREKYRKDAMQQMIDDELLYHEALKIGLKADKKEVHESREAIIKKVGGDAQYEKVLAASGLTDSEFRKKLEKRQLVKKIIEVQLDEKAVVSDKEVDEYYEANKQSFKRPESWRIRHILISVPPNALQEEWEDGRKKAEEVYKKILDGEDMASLAWDYSNDPYRVKGGDLGIVHSGMLVTELEQSVKDLEAGEITGVVQSIYGYHIARVEEKYGAEQMSLEDVSETIKASLEKRKRAQLEKELIERLRAAATIEVYGDD